MPKTTDPQDELFVVVDKDDNILGYKTRRECHSDKTLIHRSIDILVFNKTGELLLQKRSKTKDTYPGYYTVSASGHVGRGESYKEAARRELKEEIGIQVPLVFVKTFISHLPRETEMVSLYKTMHNGPFVLQPDEVDSAQFVSVKELPGLKDRLTPGAKDSFKQLNLL